MATAPCSTIWTQPFSGWPKKFRATPPAFNLLASITTCCAAGPRCNSRPKFFRLRLVSPLQLAQQAQDLEVEPYQRDHDAERAVPLHVLRRAVLYAFFNEVKVQHQVER